MVDDTQSAVFTGLIDVNDVHNLAIALAMALHRNITATMNGKAFHRATYRAR